MMKEGQMGDQRVCCCSVSAFHCFAFDPCAVGAEHGAIRQAEAAVGVEGDAAPVFVSPIP